MNKKAIAILAAIFVLIVGTLGFLILQRRSGDNSNEPVATDPIPTQNTNPDPFIDPTPDPVVTPDPTPTPDPVQFGSPATKLSDEAMLSPALFYQGNGIAYFTPDGRLFQATFQQNSGVQELTDFRELAVPAKASISKVIWPENGNNYLVELVTGQGKRWAVYVSSKGEYVDVPPQVVAIDWLPDGEQLVYFWTEPDGSATMNVSPADMSTWDAIVDLWEPDNTMSIAPDGKTILYWRDITNGASNPINMVTADGKLFRSVVKDGFNFNVAWGPDSRQFAFNKLVNGRTELWIGNMFTGQVLSTGLETSVEKTVWSLDGKTLLAAVPGSSGYDELYKVDVASAVSNIFPILGGIGSAQDMFLSLDGTRLYYLDSANGGLYYVDIGN